MIYKWFQIGLKWVKSVSKLDKNGLTLELTRSETSQNWPKMTDIKVDSNRPNWLSWSKTKNLPKHKAEMLQNTLTFRKHTRAEINAGSMKL